jgi:protocatechuate 3,4-dioxygenase beta subunit
MVLALFLLSLGVSNRVAAQSTYTSQLTGVVSDSSGAVIPGAKVTLTSNSGAGRSTTTDGSGSYSFAAATAGDYTVRASAPELTQPEVVRLTLHPGAQTLDLHLKVAATAWRRRPASGLSA